MPLKNERNEPEQDMYNARKENEFKKQTLRRFLEAEVELL